MASTFGVEDRSPPLAKLCSACEEPMADGQCMTMDVDHCFLAFGTANSLFLQQDLQQAGDFASLLLPANQDGFVALLYH